MKASKATKVLLIVALFAAAFAMPAKALDGILPVNGNAEMGDTTGWSVIGPGVIQNYPGAVGGRSLRVMGYNTVDLQVASDRFPVDEGTEYSSYFSTLVSISTSVNSQTVRGSVVGTINFYDSQSEGILIASVPIGTYSFSGITANMGTPGYYYFGPNGFFTYGNSAIAPAGATYADVNLRGHVSRPARIVDFILHWDRVYVLPEE